MAAATYAFAQNLAGIWPLPGRRLAPADVCRVMEAPRRCFSPGQRGRIERGVLVSVAIEQAKGRRAVMVEDILRRERLSRSQLRDAMGSLLRRRLLAIHQGSILLRLPAVTR